MYFEFLQSALYPHIAEHLWVFVIVCVRHCSLHIASSMGAIAAHVQAYASVNVTDRVGISLLLQSILNIKHPFLAMVDFNHRP